MAEIFSILAQAGRTAWAPPQASTSAEKVDAVFDFIFWISAFFFALIVVLMLVFVLKYRFRKDRKPGPAPRSHLGVEIVWTVIPILVVGVVFYVGFTTFMEISTAPREGYEVNVLAGDYMWLFEYPDGVVDTELHVPVEEPVLLTMRSKDFIHSLWVPAFRKKMDIVPGRYAKTWFKAIRPGEYDLYCAEYCGTGHSDMTTKVIVHEPGGFAKWLKQVSSLLSPLLRPLDLTDPEGILERLSEGGDGISRFVLESCGPETQALLEAWTGGPPSKELMEILVEDLNKLLEGASIHEAERFLEVTLSEDTQALLAKAPPPDGEDLQQLNRFLLSDAFPDQMTRGPDPVEAGKYLYERKGGCKACHSLDGTKKTGPTLKGVFGTRRNIEDGPPVLVDENYIRESIMEPQEKIAEGYGENMPTYKGRLSDREIDYLISFIKNLK